MTHFRENEHQDRYSFEERSSQYKGRQQECSTSKGRTMVKKNDSQDYNDRKENNSRRI